MYYYYRLPPQCGDLDSEYSPLAYEFSHSSIIPRVSDWETKKTLLMDHLQIPFFRTNSGGTYFTPSLLLGTDHPPREVVAVLHLMRLELGAL